MSPTSLETDSSGDFKRNTHSSPDKVAYSKTNQKLSSSSLDNATCFVTQYTYHNTQQSDSVSPTSLESDPCGDFKGKAHSSIDKVAYSKTNQYKKKKNYS